MAHNVYNVDPRLYPPPPYSKVYPLPNEINPKVTKKEASHPWVRVRVHFFVYRVLAANILVNHAK